MSISWEHDIKKQTKIHFINFCEIIFHEIFIYLICQTFKFLVSLQIGFIFSRKVLNIWISSQNSDSEHLRSVHLNIYPAANCVNSHAQFKRSKSSCTFGKLFGFKIELKEAFKKIRYYLGIFPNIGGVFPIPKTFVILTIALKNIKSPTNFQLDQKILVKDGWKKMGFLGERE